MATNVENAAPNSNNRRPPRPFRQAVARGLAVISPPLFTVLIFAWVISATDRYVLQTVTGWARDVLVWRLTQGDVRENLLPGDSTKRTAFSEGRQYYRLEDDKFVPQRVYDYVREHRTEEPLPTTTKGVYSRYVDLVYLRPYYTIPFFIALFVLVLYLLGKFMAAGIGRFFVHRLERGVHRLPLVRNVYSSVKQVSDFLFTEPDIEYTRVVAVEYPRKGIWSLGLVTGESMLDIRAAANEPILSVLVPTSPMPVTGFTVTVRKSETVDLNITIDQAFQFIVSCGVVVPPQQLQQMQAAGAALPGPAAADHSAEAAASG